MNKLLAVVIAVMALASPATAFCQDNYPNRPITIVVGWTSLTSR